MTSPLDLGELERLLAGAKFAPEQLPLTNEVKRADGDHFAWSASIFFANHKPGDRPFLSISLDSRDATQYETDTARAALIVAAVNALPSLIEEVKRLREVVGGMVNAVAYTEVSGGRRSYGLRQSFGPAFQAARAALPAHPAGEQS